MYRQRFHTAWMNKDESYHEVVIDLVKRWTKDNKTMEHVMMKCYSPYMYNVTLILEVWTACTVTLGHV